MKERERRKKKGVAGRRRALTYIAECQRVRSVGVGNASFSNHPGKGWIRQESSMDIKVKDKF